MATEDTSDLMFVWEGKKKKKVFAAELEAKAGDN